LPGGGAAVGGDWGDSSDLRLDAMIILRGMRDYWAFPRRK
jgi:hypothetical protein